MPTTVNIPQPLLDKVDERATALQLSRNKFIITALEKAIAEETTWPESFLEAINKMEAIEGENEFMDIIKESRSSKAPPEL